MCALPHARGPQLDVTDDASVSRLASWLQDTYGGVDVLVNNAGMAYKARFLLSAALG